MSKPFVLSGEPLNEFLRSFWQRQVDSAEQETPDYRHPPLPLARIKKVMKSDPDVKVSHKHDVSLIFTHWRVDDSGRWYVFLHLRSTAFLNHASCSSNPILQSLRKYVPLAIANPMNPAKLLYRTVFISEITARAFIIADSNKRRTLSRSDIAKALSKSDQFDFLIDIVPRDEQPFPAAATSTTGKKANAKVRGTSNSQWIPSN